MANFEPWILGVGKYRSTICGRTTGWFWQLIKRNSVESIYDISFNAI